MSFAERTTVPAEKTRGHIERALSKYGASGFAYAWQGHDAMVSFMMNNRHIRFVINVPSKDTFFKTSTGKVRALDSVDLAFHQEVRRRWRVLYLIIKGKLEAIETGVTEFDDEFLAHIVMPNGKTFGEWARPQIDEIASSGKMPPLLTGPQQ